MNEKRRQVFDADDIIRKVDDLPPYLQFINNACLVEFIKQSFKDARKYDSFFLHKMEKSKNYGGYLTDIHTLLHMPIELFTHTSNNIQETPLHLSQNSIFYYPVNQIMVGHYHPHRRTYLRRRQYFFSYSFFYGSSV